MTKLQIVSRGGTEYSVFDAVQEATTPYSVSGQLEQMRERIELQEKLIANLLMVMFNDYGDEYTPGMEPKNRADQLAFVLSVGASTFRVNEV